MAQRGESIENPLSGERMTFLKTTADTNASPYSAFQSCCAGVR